MSKLGDIFLHGSLAALTGAWGGVGGAVGLIVLLVTEKAVSPFWGVLIGVYVAVFIAYHGQKTALEKLRDQINDTSKRQPRIEFEKPAHGLAAVNDDKTLTVWQLWFRNNPNTWSDASIARGVSAEIQFFDSQGTPTQEPFFGSWAQTKHSEGVDWSFTSTTTDVSTPASRAKLIVLGETSWTGTLEGYEGGSWRHVVSMPSGDHNWGNLLMPNVERVRVKLAGTNLPEQVFAFLIKRGPDGEILSIGPL